MDATTYLRNKIGDKMLRNQAYSPPATIYLALYTSATDASGGGTEVVGGSYARQACALDAFASGDSQNTGTLTFPAMPACTVTHAAILDASTSGNMLLQTALDEPVEIAAGDNYVYDPATVSLQIR